MSVGVSAEEPGADTVVFGAEEPVTEALVRRLRARAVTGAVTETTRATDRAPRWVYLAAARGSAGVPDLADARAVFEAAYETGCEAACEAPDESGQGIRHLTVISSARVHEPSHYHPGWVEEDRLAVLRFGNRIAAHWRELEELARDIRDAAPGPQRARLAILRPVTVPEAADPEDPVGRLFTRRMALRLPGHDPSIQLLGLDDLCEAVARVAESDAEGTWNVAPERPVPLRRALRLAGIRAFPVPRKLQGLRRSQDQLAYLRYPWTVSGAALAEDLGWAPRSSSAEVARWIGEANSQTPLAPTPPAQTPLAAAGAAPELPDFDEWGLDPDYLAAFERTLFRFLHDVYWRVELDGLEHLPREGPAVVAGIHRGFQPWDGVMALVAIRRATGRTPRFLLHPALAKMPFLANYMTKIGAVPACRENADRVLGHGELLGIYPEGIRGAFSYYRDAYELKRFGRDEWVRMALRNQVPLVPFVTVGSAEIYPILAKLNWPWWQRWTEWPCFPITPTMGIVPLPSKWHTRFLPPIRLEQRFGPETAEDAETVREISQEIQGTMKAALDDLRARRPAIFWGSVFSTEEPEPR